MLRWNSSNKREEGIKVEWQRGVQVQKVEMIETDTKDGKNKRGRWWFIKKEGERVTVRDVERSRHSGVTAGLLQYERTHSLLSQLTVNCPYLKPSCFMYTTFQE